MKIENLYGEYEIDLRRFRKFRDGTQEQNGGIIDEGLFISSSLEKILHKYYSIWDNGKGGHCGISFKEVTFNDLDGYDWSCLLCKYPQFSDKCPWIKLEDWDWKCLLKHQPQFEKFRDQT